MEIFKIVILAYVLIVSIVGFASMGIDKKKAKNGAWRTKEATLFLIAFIGGGIGSTIGMWTFRHKTKHWYFVVGMPFAALLNIAIVLLLFFKVLV